MEAVGSEGESIGCWSGSAQCCSTTKVAYCIWQNRWSTDMVLYLAGLSSISFITSLRWLLLGGKQTNRKIQQTQCLTLELQTLWPSCWAGSISHIRWHKVAIDIACCRSYLGHAANILAADVTTQIGFLQSCCFYCFRRKGRAVTAGSLLPKVGILFSSEWV